MSKYWARPTKWTVEEANRRAFEVLSDPFLSEFDLPPEAGLLFPPKPPDYPQLHDPKTFKPRVGYRKSQKFFLRDIPWLPEPFNMDTPGWMLNLYQIFGATCRDMVERVDPKYEPNSDRQFLSNRLVKRSGDYRAANGGFCTDYKAFKNGRITAIAQAIVSGMPGKRKALNPCQIFLGVIWEIDMINLTMQQTSSSKAFPLPEPKTSLPDNLVDILVHLEIPVPTADTLGWPMPLSSSRMNVCNDLTPVTGIATAVLNSSNLFPAAVGQPIPLGWNYQAPIYKPKITGTHFYQSNASDSLWPCKSHVFQLPYWPENYAIPNPFPLILDSQETSAAAKAHQALPIVFSQPCSSTQDLDFTGIPPILDAYATNQHNDTMPDEEDICAKWDEFYYDFINEDEE